MTSRLWIAALAAPLLLLTSCQPVNRPGSVTITVDGVHYASIDAAVEAQRQTSEAGLAGLPHESDPLLGRVQIVLADRDRLRPVVLARARNLPPAGIEYFIRLDDMLQNMAANALMSTHAFETSHMVEQNDVVNPDMGGADYIVWHQVYSLNNETAWVSRWMVRRAGSTATHVALFDVGTKAYSTAWYGSFVKSVREAALQLGGKTAAGAKPANAAARGGTGSGIVVDAEHVLTNNHVVAACQTAHVFDGATTSDAPVIARDASNDLALIKISNHPRSAAAFRDSSGVRAGENIVVTGFPLNGLVSSEMAITTGSVTALKGPRDDTRILQISAPIQPGNSGGPALDTDGDVIGVVSSTLNSLLVGIATGGVIPQGVNFAIKTVIVEEFLDANRVHYEKAGAHREMSTPDIADKARKFTVRVDCH